MELLKHPIWEVISNAKTLEDFQTNYLNKVTLKPEVPTDIKAFARIVEKLLLYSYYEYEFIDLALTNAIFTFEKALRIRWKELHEKETKDIFKNLIDWFINNGYFETSNKLFPHVLRDIRNGHVHETSKSLGGIAFFNKVYLTLDLINDLYEDPTLRSVRKQATHSLSDELSKFTTSGTILSCNQGSLIINEVFPVFINNKNDIHTVCLFVSPIFDLSSFKAGEHCIPPHFTVQLTDWRFENHSFRAVDKATGAPVSLDIIEDEINIERYSNWITEFHKLNNWALIKYIATEPMGDIFISALRKFHAS